MPRPRRLRIGSQTRVRLDIETAVAVTQLLPLKPFDEETGGVGDPAGRQIVHPVAQFETEQPGTEGPGRDGGQGAAGVAVAACIIGEPIVGPRRVVTTVDRAQLDIADGVTVDDDRPVLRAVAVRQTGRDEFARIRFVSQLGVAELRDEVRVRATGRQ